MCRNFSIFIVVLAAVVFSSPAVGKEVSVQSLKQYGLAPLQPVEAPDFDLLGVLGPGHTLSDFSGDWVLLTFFATWCGPCMQEMPSLDALHKELSPTLPFGVVGVSIDNTRPPVERFARKKNLSFPLLHDAKGAAANAYQANSVPLSYLINPDGQLVAMARGARDWQRVVPLLRQIATGEGGAVAAGNVPTLEELAPPKTSVEVMTERPMVGEEIVIDVVVDWAGKLDNYDLLPPGMQLPAGLKRVGSSVSSSSLDSQSVARFHFRLIAEEAIDYPLGSISVRYFSRDGQREMSALIDGPILSVSEANSASMLSWQWTGVCLVVMSIPLILVWSKREIIKQKIVNHRVKSGEEND